MNFRLVLALVTLFTAGAFAREAPDAAWSRVDDAAKKGLPKTAIETLQTIERDAIARQAYPEAIKALAERVALDGDLHGGAAERITLLQQELEHVPTAMRPMLEVILAEWYWRYFQQNRWRFMQRTATSDPTSTDFTTWDLRRILGEIDRRFTTALAHAAELKRIPIADYSVLLTTGTVPDSYRPTLYDFIAHEALNFYLMGEQGVTVGEEAFELSADSPIFDDAATFMRWAPTATETNPALEAIRLFQTLLAFHRDDRDRSAFYDLDRERLRFGYNTAVGDDKDARYRAALERFVARTAQHPISSQATVDLAESLMATDRAKAHALLVDAIHRFPSSPGGVAAENLRRQIEAPSATVTTEYVWNAPWPTLDVTYANVTTLYFRAYRVEDPMSAAWWNGGVRPFDIRSRLSGKPARQWQSELPSTPDFKSRTEKIPVPTDLPHALYLIVASARPDFRDDDNLVAVCHAWVSNLALVLRENVGASRHEGLVVDAASGAPIAGATVTAWGYTGVRPERELARAVTNSDGEFSLGTFDVPTVLTAAVGTDFVGTFEPSYTYNFGPKPPQAAQTQVVFFTDRALYRPGQSIQYKGISVRYDRNRNTYEVEANAAVTVVFQDSNGQEIARAEHRTNDYGSFSGQFVAPRGRLNGQMSIRTADGVSATWFGVEEYKRPKFEVTLAPPAHAPRLGDIVKVTGTALAYTAAPIGEAHVRWRVVRRVRLPLWCWWWRPPQEKAIAHGSAMTDADGKFEIAFTAAPDRAVPPANEPVFDYGLYADVTDSTGETRSNQRDIPVGYAALQATVSAEEWQSVEKPVSFSVATTSLDGEPQAVRGSVAILALRQPRKVTRASLGNAHPSWFGTSQPVNDVANPDSWETAEQVANLSFATDATGKQTVSTPLAPGIYRALLRTQDGYGQVVTARHTFEVVDPADIRCAVKLPSRVLVRKASLEPGETFQAVWGTGYESGRALVELERDGKPLAKYWTPAGGTQSAIAWPVSDELRGGFTLRVTFVHENRLYSVERVIDVPWTNKQLHVTWGTFHSKLRPGQAETWTATVTGPDNRRAAAELVAGMYDASLDQFEPLRWPEGFAVFRTETWRGRFSLQNRDVILADIARWNESRLTSPDWTYRRLPGELGGLPSDENEGIQLSPFEVSGVTSFGYMGRQTLMGGLGGRVRTELRDIASTAGAVSKAFLNVDGQNAAGPARPDPVASVVTSQALHAATLATPPVSPNLGTVVARRALNETAFFLPSLTTDANGTVTLNFTVPEALTQWKVQCFAHDRELRAGLLSATAVTSKELMVEPNPPRFIREGDTIEFTVKVTNRTDAVQRGTVRLSFSDAETERSVDDALANRVPEQSFEVPANGARTYSWRIVASDGLGPVTYKAVAASETFSDGEEGVLPVLSRRVLVTESLPLPVRGAGTKRFEFSKLLESGRSSTLRSEALTVEMTPHPAWYAVMALPYLMEYPYECSEQVFNRYYANALARHIAASNPKIHRVFELWRNTPALESPLEKNQDLKSVTLEETPWVRAAQTETQGRHNVGLLFDDNRLNAELSSTWRKLDERRQPDGMWSWFPGGPSSPYITLYIVAGFGRLHHLGVVRDAGPAVRSLFGLSQWAADRYREIMRTDHPNGYVPSSTDALYLYARSLYVKERPVGADERPVLDYFLGQARKNWLQTNCRQSQGQLALAFERFGDHETALAIMRSLKERSVNDPELGMTWRDGGESWWWYNAPIETQALMIEAFDEVSHDAQAVDDCRVWLLKQKQTQAWRTTKATADAVYALLLRGTDELTTDARVEVSLGGQTVQPEHAEAGTGYYEEKFVRGEIKPEMGHVTITKSDAGVSWGSVHWQYLDDVAKVTPHEGTPLQLKKTLWVKHATAHGQELSPVRGAVSIGDELVVRVELSTDRDLEFVHLKDQRASGTEPVNVLSQYKYQDGLGYYESTRDAATHFFIDYLRRGTHVFEYSTRVQLRGSYQTGIAEIQCMYAPEFNSHSESLPIDVK